MLKGHLRRSLMQRAYLYTTNVIQRIYSTPMVCILCFLVCATVALNFKNMLLKHLAAILSTAFRFLKTVF